jgi:hypothetical protein
MKYWPLAVLLALLCLLGVAQSQQSSGVSVIGTVTPGNCTQFASGLQLKDAGGPCGLGGGSTPVGPASGDLTGTYPGPLLATVNSNVGTFGSSTQCSIFTVNAKGLLTAASQVACAGGGGGAPTGPAGGALAGTYPNPTLAVVNSNVGTFGSSTQCPTFTVNASGLLTAASQTACAGGGGAPTGPAGGVLSGTYPNPGMAVGAAATNLGSAGGVLTGSYPSPGMAVGAAATNLGAAGGVLTGTYPSPGMAIGAAATNLGAAGGDLTGTYPSPLLATVNANVGTFGSATQCSVFTVNGKGLLTAASQVACAGGGGVTINGPVTAGDCTQFFSATQISDAGAPCGTSGGGGTPSGPAGGVLAGTYPNPGMAVGAAATNLGAAGGALAGSYPSPSLAVGAAATNLGAASGDLTGTYPGPLLATVNSNTGTFGSTTQCPTFTVNGKGLITAASQAACAGGGGGPPTGAAGGVLSGTYPNPGMAVGAAATNLGSATGDLTGTYPSPVLATVNSNVGTFGSATNCATFTVNAKGLLTAASQTACAGGSSPGAFTDAVPTSPASTMSTTNIMGGIGNVCNITTLFRNRINITITGGVSNSGVSNTTNFGASIGTGTAPSAGAALTGTLLSPVSSMQNNASSTNFSVPFAINFIKVEPVGTYWIDLVYSSSSAGGSAQVSNLHCIIFEM